MTNENTNITTKEVIMATALVRTPNTNVHAWSITNSACPNPSYCIVSATTAEEAMAFAMSRGYTRDEVRVVEDHKGYGTKFSCGQNRFWDFPF
jgi:hypothetical protein